MTDSLPYLAEYAKSGRSSCKKCKENIPQGALRLAVVFQAAKFDGKMTSWYHFDCFFVRQRPKSAGDIEHFDLLRWEDQEKINEKIKSTKEEISPKVSNKKGKKEGSKEKVVEQFSDFRVEYSKSSRAACRGCLEKIPKDEVRISKKEMIKHGQMADAFYHVKCFKERREELEFFDEIEKVPGFTVLLPKDQKQLSQELPALPVKKRKIGDDTVDGESHSVKKIKKDDEEDEKSKEEMKKQNKVQFKYRDQLESVSKKDLEILLESNEQEIPSGMSEKLDHLSDIMTFGALLPCTECKTGQLFYRSGIGYVCSGNMSGWTKCPNTTTKPKRRPVKIPKELAEEYTFLKKYKYVERDRIIPALVRTQKTEPKEKDDSKTPSTRTALLKGLTFALDPKLDRSRKDLENAITKFGGSAVEKVNLKTAAVISNKKNLESMNSRLNKAAELGIPVVEVNVLDEIEKGTFDSVTSLITRRNIAPWDCKNIDERLKLDKSEGSKSKSGSGMSDKVKLKLKGGGVVDPDSGMQDKAHVLSVNKTSQLYSVVLGMVDIQEGRNSYYKLQVLEHDKADKWYVFRSWGRVGTTIGDTRLTKMEDKSSAIDEFIALYEEKTGNLWKDRKNFKKKPGKFYPLDIDYGEAESAKPISSANSKSELHKSVQDLICMLFDIDAMKRTMVEFELDLTKMPLGKLSKKQIEQAYSVLSQTQNLLNNNETQEAKFVDISNQFYTLIPHDFGRKSPPIINNHELIKAKLAMLETLLEIEIAFNMLKAGESEKDKDPIDIYYEKLNTKIEILEKTSEEFELIQSYVENTHAATHNQYSLEVEEVFKVVRKGESKRFKPFSKLPNRKLLWHGSRVSNMAGILAQGLRIAPPEAPVTGYMFGKGIYFADMVSKSANYCVTSKSNPVGLLLLCDVALGSCYERKEADYIEKLKKKYQSVLGVGKTQPNPEESKMMGEVEVPLGKPVPSKVSGTSLLYNEYIVYDVAQVNIKYLLKTKFHYK